MGRDKKYEEGEGGRRNMRSMRGEKEYKRYEEGGGRNMRRAVRYISRLAGRLDDAKGLIPSTTVQEIKLGESGIKSNYEYQIIYFNISCSVISQISASCR